MQWRALIPTTLLPLVLAWCLIPLAYAGASSYFEITTPQKGDTWANGATNLVTWTKGLFDGVGSVDVEMSRLSEDGLIYVARDVPTDQAALNIYLEDVPTGDDYYLLFINSTHGVMYSISPKFSVSSTVNTTSPSPNSAVPTVTVSGGPNPTAGFATTFPATANGALGWAAVEGSKAQLVGVLSALTMCLLSALAVL